MVSMTHVNYIFVAEDIEYRCRVPGCENDHPTVQVPSWWPQGTDPKCFKPVLDLNKYNINNHTCSNSSFVEIIEECHDWIYESNNSIVAELNLGCQSWKATLVGSIHNAGMIASMMFAGWISDKIGRKPTIIICSVGGAIGVVKIFITNYYAYLGVEFLESLLASGLYTVAVVLLIELGGEAKRVSAGVIFSYAVYVGEVTFAFIAMGLKYWKFLILVVYTPMALFVFYILCLKESTRWQMLRGRTQQAKDTFKCIAKLNKLEVTPKEIEDLSEEELRFKLNVQIQKEKETIKDILGSKEIMVRLAVTSFCFFTSSFLYYGSMVHSVLLPGNKYTNFVLASVTSFPGDLLAFYTFNKFGRRITLQWGYFGSAVFLIAQTYAPASITWLKVLLFLFSKLGVVVCFTGIYTYSLELFPTSVRGSLVGCGNTAARIGSMLAPLTPLLVTHLDSLPSILFSSTAIAAAVLLTFTPETKTLPLFDTIAQIEAYRSKVSTHL
ncbi:organic cation transporter protein-like [Hyposmocoma kahamanoa]|uniref:organic cation transporter protein-like n=1 Tax=Hyposmocoma kahamanoa TaxID=1477025 RepID=UPI000E6D9CE4|nr:organic cation transporter protein-like [Hyposmocoma kahamanoa]